MPKAIGVGSPIVDLLAQVEESFVEGIDGAKGGMELVSPEAMEALVASLTGPQTIAPGGSAGNTTFAMAKLGLEASFLGKLGLDADGTYYKEQFQALGGDVSRFQGTSDAHTARCLSLITPDGERTMRTDLGAAALLGPQEARATDFAGFDVVHLEGYLLFNRDLMTAVLEATTRGGAPVSLDLGSFEVVKAAADILPDMLKNSVDIVFANEDEAEAFCGTKDPEKALAALGELCETAAVKLGGDGALLKRGGETCRVPAVSIEKLVDTTGAGDLWAAGFLAGWTQGKPLETCGKMGAILGGAVVQIVGASLPEPTWTKIQAEIAAL